VITEAANILSIQPAKSADREWCQRVVVDHHYLHKLPDPRARTMTYAVRLGGYLVGTVMLGIPHATRCAGWWGYPGLPTQWQVVDLCRIWLHPDVQTGGPWCERGMVPGFVDRHGDWRPTLATWVIKSVLARVQRDRVAMWPPVYPEQPYHIRLAISYHDPRYHNGAIYRHSQAQSMYVGADGKPMPGSSGKYGWAWKLSEPTWNWGELTGISPRTFRMEFTT
jgi:hypothetical protein